MQRTVGQSGYKAVCTRSPVAAMATHHPFVLSCLVFSFLLCFQLLVPLGLPCYITNSCLKRPFVSQAACLPCGMSRLLGPMGPVSSLTGISALNGQWGWVEVGNHTKFIWGTCVWHRLLWATPLLCPLKLLGIIPVFFFRGSVCNVLLTSCHDGICRLWAETLLPEDSLLGEQICETSTSHISSTSFPSHSGRHKDHIQHALEVLWRNRPKVPVSPPALELPANENLWEWNPTKSASHKA